MNWPSMALGQILLLLDTHIAHKDILFLHELIFCVDLDFLLLLLDTHIAHKDILILHEPNFCVDLDFLLLLLDTHITHKNILILHSPISKCWLFRSSVKAKVVYLYESCLSWG